MHATQFLFASSYNVLILFVFVLFIVKAARLFPKIKSGESDESDISKSLTLLLFLSGAMILLGCLGYFSELATAPCKTATLPGGSFVTVMCTVVESAEQAQELATCFGKSASAMATGLIAAAVSSLIWFSLQQKSAK